jgi:hypothetical protein
VHHVPVERLRRDHQFVGVPVGEIVSVGSTVSTPTTPRSATIRR